MYALRAAGTQPLLGNTLRMTCTSTAHSSPITNPPVGAMVNAPGQSTRTPTNAATTQHAVAIPPTPLSTQLGAHVEHFSPPQPGLLSALLAEHFSLPTDFILSLLQFGALYHCPVHPLPPSCLPPADAERILAIREAGLRALGRPPTHQDQVPCRLEADCTVSAWCYIRVHLHPKRFPLAYGVDWKSRILVHNDAFVVIDKPPGVSVVPRVDNRLECCLRLTADALGLEHPLLSTHRLDTYTQGVLVMARQPQHVGWFNTHLQGGSAPQGEGQLPPLTKVYRALTATPPALGLWQHAAWVNVRLPGLPAFTIMLPVEQLGAHFNGKAGAIAQLQVIDVQQVALTGPAATRWGPSAYESTVRLITGRTHQIRAQLAAEGAPLLGDPLYTALHALHGGDYPPEGPGSVVATLRVAQGAFEQPAGRQQPAVGTPRALQDAEDAMGLQAWQLHVRVEGPLGGPCVLEAGTPWWRA